MLAFGCVSCLLAREVVSCPNVPDLHTENFEFRAVVAERFVSERRAGARYALFEVVVKPQSVVTIPMIVSLTFHLVSAKPTLPRHSNTPARKTSYNH